MQEDEKNDEKNDEEYGSADMTDEQIYEVVPYWFEPKISYNSGISVVEI